MQEKGKIKSPFKVILSNIKPVDDQHSINSSMSGNLNIKYIHLK